METSPAGNQRQWATPSLVAAGCLLSGLVAGELLPIARLSYAIALGALALALGGSARRIGLGLAIGLTVSWCQPSPSAGLRAVDRSRPVVALVHQLAPWRLVGEQWRTVVRIERLRQRVRVWRPAAEVTLLLPGGDPPSGARWRLRGYLRRPPPLANGLPSVAGPWRLTVKSHRLLTTLAPRGYRDRGRIWLHARRAELAAAVDRAAGGRVGGALARALALGDRGTLPARWRRGLRRAGLAHVVALSGLHLGVVALWCSLLCRRRSAAVRWAVILITTLLYLAVAGASPSLLRSWLMVAAVGATTLARRPGRALHALSWAAAVLALASPGAVHDLAFQLTFAASAGILVAQRLLASGARQGGWRSVVAMSVGAQLATLPLAPVAFHWLPLWSWSWNLFLGPVIAAAIPLCLLWTAVAVVLPSLASATVGVLDLLAAALALPTVLPAKLAGGVPWAAGTLATLSLAGGLALLLVGCRRRSLTVALVAVVALAALALLGGTAGGITTPGRPSAACCSVHMLDVGQGDAVLLRDGGGALLVDGGGWRGPGVAERALLPSLARLGVRRLEVVVVSHADRDHCGGLVELIDYLPVGEIWLSPGVALAPCGRALTLVAGVTVRPLWRGAEARWRSWRFRVLNPWPGERGSGNEASLVLAARGGGRSLLLTGDIGQATEAGLFEVGDELLSANLLKVAHHGSRYSSSALFLRAVGPQLALISAGVGNSYGHPAGSVIERLETAKVLILSTDRVGQIGLEWTNSRQLTVTMPGSPRGAP